MVTGDVTLNVVGAATVAPAPTVTWTKSVPEMHGSGSRTRLSFSKAASTTYLPGGTPVIVKLPPTSGATPGSGARRPGTVVPRPVTGSKVDSTVTMIDVTVPPPGPTMLIVPFR